jgi:hypothetical protein
MRPRARRAPQARSGPEGGPCNAFGEKKIRGLARGALAFLAVTLSATASSSPAAIAEGAFEFTGSIDLARLWPEGCEIGPVMEWENVSARCGIEYEKGHFLIVDSFLGWDWFSESELKGARVEERAVDTWMGWIESEIAASAPGWTERHFSKRVSRRVPANKSADVVFCVEYEREFENRGIEGFEGVGYLTRSRWLVCGERAIVIKQGAENQYPAVFAVVGVKETYAPELGHAPRADFDRIVDEVFSAFTW